MKGTGAVEAKVSETRVSPRDRRRTERMALIRDTALELLVEGGLDAFSIHRLAERLDLTVGALYRYYGSVDALLIAVQIDVLEAFDVYLGRVEADDGAEGLARIWLLVQAYVVWSECQPQRFRLISRLVSSPDPLFDDAAAWESVIPTMKLLGRLGQAFEGAVEAGELSSGVALTRAVIAWSSLQGLLERRKLSRLQPEVFSFEPMLEELMRALWVGWGASVARSEAVLSLRKETRFFEERLRG